MLRRIDNLRDHYVVCAFGRVGRSAVEELRRAGADVVVIEVDTSLEPVLAEADIPHLIDDPATESALERAGIRRAKALLCAVDSDAVNVYITLTARAMNPDLIIIARASQPASVETLRRAGSDRVVPLYSVSGARMAALALQPAVLEFVDMVSVAPDLRIEELRIGDRSPLASMTVRDMCEPHANVMVLAVRGPDGTVLVPPQAETVIGNGDLLIILGPADALTSLAAQAG